MKCLLLILSILQATFSFGQTLKTYTGSLSTQYNTQTGECSYTYYDDSKSMNRIKHGQFSYVDKQKNLLGGTYMKQIKGQYENGYKNGMWMYEIEYKDYLREELTTGLEYTATGKVQLTAFYKNGIPYGLWTYKNKTEARKVHKNILGELEYSDFVPATNIEIQLPFKNNTFSGSFYYKNGMSTLQGDFNLNGRMNNKSTLKTSRNEEITTYVNGYIKERVNRKATGEVIEYEVFDMDLIEKLNNGNLDKNEYSTNGIESISNRNIFKDNIINLSKTVYNNDDFMYTTIVGDKSVIADNYGNISKVNTNGGDYYRIEKLVYQKLDDLYDFKYAQEQFQNERFEEAIKSYREILEKCKNGAYHISTTDEQTVKRSLEIVIEASKNKEKTEKQEELEYDALSVAINTSSNSLEQLANKSFNKFVEQSGCTNRICKECTKITYGDIDGNGSDDIVIHYILEPTREQSHEFGRGAIYENEKILILFSENDKTNYYVKSAYINKMSNLIDYSLEGSIQVSNIENNVIHISLNDLDKNEHKVTQEYRFKYNYNQYNGTTLIKMP